MRFLVDAQYLPDADPAPWLEAEKQRVQELHEAGVFEQVLVRLDGGGAYVVAVAEDEAALQAHLATLPFLEHGIMEMPVQPIDVIWPAG